MKTDAQLQQDVMAELEREPAVPATQIGVEVRKGVATLAGRLTVMRRSGTPSARCSVYPV